MAVSGSVGLNPVVADFHIWLGGPSKFEDAQLLRLPLCFYRRAIAAAQNEGKRAAKLDLSDLA